MPEHHNYPPNLMHLDLPFARLTGATPNQLVPSSSLSNLLELNLSGNELVGAMPIIEDDTPSIEHLDLSSSSLNGAVPSKLSNLIELNLSSKMI